MTLDEIIEIVSKDMGLSKSITDRIYKAYWKAVRDHITSLPLKEDLKDEEFLQLQPNVNIPSIGKLHVTLDRYHRVKNFNEIIKQKTRLKRERNAAHKED